MNKSIISAAVTLAMATGLTSVAYANEIQTIEAAEKPLVLETSVITATRISDDETELVGTPAIARVPDGVYESVASSADSNKEATVVMGTTAIGRVSNEYYESIVREGKKQSKSESNEDPVELRTYDLRIDDKSPEFIKEVTPPKKNTRNLNTVSEEQVKLIDSLMAGYTPPVPDEHQVKYENDSIEKIEEIYFSQGNYDSEDLQELFTNFISMGLNRAADYIIENENVSIDVNAFNAKGITPLIASAISIIEGGNAEYTAKLIKMGADVNLGTEFSEITPTSFASITDNYQTLALLLASGAKFMKIDKLDYRPIDYAIANNSEKSAALLSEALSARVQKEMQKEPMLDIPR